MAQFLTLNLTFALKEPMSSQFIIRSVNSLYYSKVKPNQILYVDVCLSIQDQSRNSYNTII